MEDFIQNTLPQFLLYKYAALFAITFLSAFALPLPSTTSLVTAAGFASQGHLHIGLVILWAILGNVVADNLIYWITRFFGISVLQFHFSKSSAFRFIVENLDRHPKTIVFWSRFQVIPTIAVNFLSGIAKSDYRTFFVYGFLGETAQVLLFAGIGYFFGASVSGVTGVFGKTIFIIIVGILITSALFRKGISEYLKRRFQDVP